MNWLSNVISTLKKEPETWLLYLYGQQLENFPHLKDAKPRFRGVFFRCVSFFYNILRYSSSHRKPTNNKTSKIFVYAGTRNQKNVLTPTIDGLLEEGVSVCAFAKPKALNSWDQEKNFREISLGPKEIIKITQNS